MRTQKEKRIIVVRRTTPMAEPMSVKYVVKATCPIPPYIPMEGRNMELAVLAGEVGAALEKTQRKLMWKDRNITHLILRIS